MIKVKFLSTENRLFSVNLTVTTKQKSIVDTQKCRERNQSIAVPKIIKLPKKTTREE